MKWFRKHRVFTRILLSVLILLLVLMAVVVGYVWSKLSLIDYDDGSRPPENPVSAEIGDATQPSEESNAAEAEEQLVDISGLEMMDTLPPLPASKIPVEKDVLNILVLGTDERTKELNEAARSDSMILVSINKTDKTVKLVSFERGMGVPVLWGQYEGQYDWMTHIFRYGGAEMVCAVVEECFRVEVDYYVRVNFTTVKTAVDAIGGIDIELTRQEAGALNVTNAEWGRYEQARLQEGMNHLDGQSALLFARLRRIDSDWKRVERQRKVILATVDALKGSSIVKLNDLLDQVLPLVQTDMNTLQIAELMLYSPNFLNSEFDQMTIPKEGTYGGMRGMGGRGLFAVDFEVNSQILREFLYGEAEK